MVFAFEATHWDDVIDHTFKLTKVFRQKDQSTQRALILCQNSTLTLLLAFVTMLNEMRFGKLSEQSIQQFKALSRTVNWNDGIEPTELCAPRSSRRIYPY